MKTPKIIEQTVFNQYQLKAVNIAASLTIPDGWNGEKLGDKWFLWQPEFIAKIFESLKEFQTTNGVVFSRTIREFFLLIPKKNGKSTLSGALAIVFMLLNKRLNNEFAIIAPTKIVALNSFLPAKAMINADTYLKSRFKITDTTKTIYDLKTQSKITIYSADTNTVSGIKAAFVIFDELWKLCENKNIENILLEAKGGFAAKSEAFCVYLTTQSETPPHPAFQRFLELARRPLDEQAAAGFYSLVFEPENQSAIQIDDVTIDLIDKVNPNLGLTVDKNYLITEFNKYKQIGGDAFLSFCAKHLNLQIKTEFVQNGWAGAEYWQQAEITADLEYICENCEVVIVGIDGGGLDDLIGICVAGRVSNSQNWIMWHSATCTTGALSKNNTEKIYENFIEKNEMHAFENIMGCFEYIAKIVNLINDYNVLSYIGMDINGAAVLSNFLMENCDIIESQIIGIFQGNRLSSAIKTLEQMLAIGSLKVNRTDLMRWQIGNIKMNGRYFFEKTEKKAKIDSAVAMAITAVILQSDPIPLSSDDIGMSI